MDFITIPSKPVVSVAVKDQRRALLAAERRDKFAQHSAPQTVRSVSASAAIHAHKCKKDISECRICNIATQMFTSIPPMDLAAVLEQPMPSRGWSFFGIALENARDRATHNSWRGAADMHVAAQMFAGFKDRHPKEYAQLSR